MTIEICTKVFKSQTAGFRLDDLAKLLSDATFRNRYRLKLYPQVLTTDGFRQLDSRLQEILRQIVINSGNSNPAPDCYITPKGDTVTDEKFFSVREGIVYVNTPLSILVENNLNDACFFRAIFKAFSPGHPIEAYEQERWLTFDNAGGCGNVPNYIEGELKSNGYKPKMLKCFVLLDSDRRYTGDEHKQQTVVTYLEQKGIPSHVLEKRMMENYLPDEAFEEMRNPANDEWISCYLHLSPRQKDYIKIHDGIDGDIPDKAQRGKGLAGKALLPKEVRDFYDGLSDRQYETLSRGMVLTDFKTRFPKSFEHHTVYRDTLSARTSHQSDTRELETIVTSILSLL